MITQQANTAMTTLHTQPILQGAESSPISRGRRSDDGDDYDDDNSVHVDNVERKRNNWQINQSPRGIYLCRDDVVSVSDIKV